MAQLGRRLRAIVNPVSTSASGWWCHSGLRRMLTGYGPTARQRRLVRDEIRRRKERAPSAQQKDQAPSAQQAEQMRMRAAAIDELMRRD
jgi:hypothetical protein